MGTSQLMLVIGSILLLSVLSLNYFNAVRNKTDINLYNEAMITGTGVAQSIIEEISTRAFDEKTVAQAVTLKDSLTAVGSLGPDAGEYSAVQFDDVDDFRNYTLNDTLPVLGIFTVRTNVNYAAKLNPDIISASQTFTKRIDVFVTNAYLTDTVKLSQVITY